MVSGWRRAFCTSIPKDKETPIFSNKKKISDHQQEQCSNSPRISSKFGFFSNPSTPRLHSKSSSSSSTTISSTAAPRNTLRCRTTTAISTPPISSSSSSVPTTPKLIHQSKTNLFHFSNPSSPKSPSTFTLLKATLRLSRNRCGICIQSVKGEQGTSAIFTAECNHVFHFSCISSRFNSSHQNLLICPVCNLHWTQLPSISSNNPPTNTHHSSSSSSKLLKNLRVYNDDEPLLSPSPGSLFVPIPENDVEFEDDDFDSDNNVSAQQFQGFFVNPALAIVKTTPLNQRHLDLAVSPDSAVVSPSRSHQTHVFLLKLRAPPSPAARRPPLDLVTVLDVSDRMGGVRLQFMKRVMRVVLSSLNSNDRLSIVAFSGISKRLLPLRRMTADGRRSARRLVDALGTTGQRMSAIDALKKAAKVIEDRRVKNPLASIIILSNGQDDRSHSNSINHKRSSVMNVSSTRFCHLEIPVHSISLENTSASKHAMHEDTIAKTVNGLLTVSVQEVKLQLGSVSSGSEISSVYSLNGPAGVFSPGSVRLGDLNAEEERELLVELKVQGSSVGSHHVLSVQSSFKDPASQEIIVSKEQAMLLPRPQAVRSSPPNIQRLRELHISTRALAESRKLMDQNDYSAAYHLLSSARGLLMQSSDVSANEHVQGLEAELGEVHRRRQHVAQSQRQRNCQQVEEKTEPLTPTSAWRAAERLAKVAIMRKHMNRVSDLHGFENARF